MLDGWRLGSEGSADNCPLLPVCFSLKQAREGHVRIQSEGLRSLRSLAAAAVVVRGARRNCWHSSAYLR